MHGRLKVRTTAEQEEARRRERAEKVQIYRETTGRIFAKRAAGELDEEALRLTREVLSQNPDITTLWNYRKEILRAKLTPDLSHEEATKLCQNELHLLEKCLHVNPKSYCVWLHRNWVMTQAPSPDWGMERKLCSLFLKFDERNFHCWDYLRSVVSKLGIPPEEELAFTHEKIASNFSNYSAWHYRSTLLPKVHPSPTMEGGVTKEALAEEHELVQNAFFTDPSDQSAWFYHRWLLGKADKPLALACLFFKRGPPTIAYVVFNQPTKVTSAQPIQITVNSSPVTTSLLQSDWPESLWVCPIPSDVISSSKIVVKVNYATLEAAVTLQEGQDEGWWLGSLGDTFGCPLTAATPSLLRSELEACQELLQLEPKNKWCLLTTQFLMQALDPQQYSKTISEILKKLVEVDPYRQGYYTDLLSKFQTEQSLVKALKEFDTSSQPLDLSNKELSRLYHTEHMLLFREVSLASNQLTTLHDVTRLCRVQTLDLDDNQLETLPEDMAMLPELRVLSLRKNNITKLEGLFGLRGSPVAVLRLEGNPVCQLEGLREKLSGVLTHLTDCY